jgi:CRISPR/Cas system-associated exonuclease Cas4 (RecB family)
VGDTDGPRWLPDTWISPSALNTFSTCPHKVKLQYIDKLNGRPGYNVDLSKGRIAHSILAHAANVIKRGFEPPDEAWIAKSALQRLPFDAFPSDEERVHHANNIVHWVLYGLDHLDHAADYLIVERPQHVEWPILPDQPFTFITRPDLVLLRTDRDGEPFIEIIDYKTGKSNAAEMVPVLTRLIFKQFLAEHVETEVTRVVFTYIWLEKRETEQVELTREECTAQWPGIIGKIRSLVTETTWQPRPSRYCHYCNYRGNACKFGQDS